MAEPRAMALVDVAERVNSRVPGLVTTSGPADSTMIQGITDDSRLVAAGALFCAVRGGVSDGHDFIDAAVTLGAGAILAEEVRTSAVPTLLTDRTRQATAECAAAVYDYPADELTVVGVTGTNGKTSIVTLVQHLLQHAGRRAESFGTLTGTLTTAAAPQFQSRLRDAADRGIDVVAAEVSSHALAQHRVDGTRFTVGVFTNLSQDHLDYHESMSGYFEAKARLFSMSDRAIIDVSNEYGRQLADRVDIPTTEVDANPASVDLSPTESGFEWRGRRVTVPLGGRFNVTNAILAAETAVALGLTIEEVIDGLAKAPQIPGRFEWVDAGQPFGIVVDYSHTPAGLEAAIATARELIEPDDSILVVFGAGGDRDPGKRPLMGAASLAADVVIVTSDNPRTEDPDAIIDQIFEGIEHSDGPTVLREPDRRAAIHRAIEMAAPSDLVLIAGKGHESYQVIGDVTHDFDDRLVAAQSAASREGQDS